MALWKALIICSKLLKELGAKLLVVRSYWVKSAKHVWWWVWQGYLQLIFLLPPIKSFAPHSFNSFEHMIRAFHKAIKLFLDACPH